MLALVGAIVVSAAIINIHPGGAPRQFFANGCGFEIQFNGTTLDDKDTPSTLDDEYTWSYTVTDLNGPGCALSHWVLELCKSDPEGTGAFSAYIDGKPEPSDLVDPDPGNTGRTGVKWNDLSPGPDFTTGTFTVTLDENFALDPDVPVAFKTSATAPNVDGTIEGPSCGQPPPVGGIVHLRVGGGPDSSASEVGDSGSTLAHAALVRGLAGAATFVVLAAGGWYAHRRRLA